MTFGISLGKSVTFSCEPLALVLLELLIRSLELQRLVAVGLRQLHLHRPSVQIEAIHIHSGLSCGLPGIEDNESLAFPLEAAFGLNVDDVSILIEDSHQRLLERLNFDILIQIFDLRKMRLSNAPRCAMSTHAVDRGRKFDDAATYCNMAVCIRHILRKGPGILYGD